MSEAMPFKNVHSAQLLECAVRVANNSDAMDVPSLCALGVQLQTSLRAANADSPRINSDPAFRLVMVALGERLGLGVFTDFSAAYAVMERDQGDTGPRGQRARWADMAQGGAVNLTPMAKSLHSAAIQVAAEGGDPARDECVRLIAHQMSFIAQTHSLALKDPPARNLRAWCKSALAALAIDNVTGPVKALAP